MKDDDEVGSIINKDDEESKTDESCNDGENGNIADWEKKYNNFEVYCCPGEKYDFSSIEYNNVIDGELRDLKVNIRSQIYNVT